MRQFQAHLAQLERPAPTDGNVESPLRRGRPRCDLEAVIVDRPGRRDQASSEADAVQHQLVAGRAGAIDEP